MALEGNDPDACGVSTGQTPSPWWSRNQTVRRVVDHRGSAGPAAMRIHNTGVVLQRLVLKMDGVRGDLVQERTQEWHTNQGQLHWIRGCQS